MQSIKILGLARRLKLEDLNLISGTHIVEEKMVSFKLSLGLHTCTMMFMHCASQISN